MPATPLDEADLRRRTEAALKAICPDGVLGDITPLQGGTSSLTFWTTFTPIDSEAQKLVLKVAPAGLAPTKNRDVLRQARIQSALRETGVPVPGVVAEDEGSPPEIPPFFAMRFEPGDCVEPNFLPTDEQLPAEHVRGRQLDAARLMGLLHTTDPDAVGLGDEPEKSLAEEAEHWINSFAACDEDLRAGTEGIGERLLATTPAPAPSTLIHGDFRLGNALAEGDRVTSIIDWEIWARADARIDLAWFLMMANPDSGESAPGMPAESELLRAYEDARGVRVQEMSWFSALVRFKQAAAGALITRNARRRGSDVSMIGGNPALLASARQLLGT